jgi:hypothetical protein
LLVGLGQDAAPATGWSETDTVVAVLAAVSLGGLALLVLSSGASGSMPNGGASPTARVESNRVKFERTDGSILSLPASYGTFHDPTGKTLPRCSVFFGPWKRTSRRVDASLDHRRYFGGTHDMKIAEVDIPKGGWHPVAKVKQIFYVRRGTRAPGAFHHPFKKSLTLSQSGSFYKLGLGGSCLVDWRGYVYP